jgi:hypothetical protein
VAAGHPQIGGTNGVALLDFGQVGGTRELAGNARFSGRLIAEADERAVVENRLPQQQAVYRDLLGYAGRRIRIVGVVRFKTQLLWQQVEAELNQRMHGSYRSTSTGELEGIDPSMVRATKLTDSDGKVLAARAVIEDWRMGERMTNTEWAVMARFDLTLRVL